MKALRFLVRLPLLAAILRAACSEFEGFRRLHGGRWAQIDWITDFDDRQSTTPRRIWIHVGGNMPIPHWSLRPQYVTYP